MRAVICRAWGPVDDLKLEDVARPKPGPGQLVIDIKATGVTYADSIMVAGRYQTRPPFPFSPGLETAGVVTRRGEGVTRFKTGDRVMAILAYGGFAEQALADEIEERRVGKEWRSRGARDHAKGDAGTGADATGTAAAGSEGRRRIMWRD